MLDSPLIFGEILYDSFPDGTRVPGGAPFNVAWHLAAFGCKPRLVSSVGQDGAGNDFLKLMENWGMTTELVALDAKRPTGLVQVTFTQGEPQYEIVENSAWDNIELSCDPTKLFSSSKKTILYSGSLAMRSSTSRSTWNLLAKEPSCTSFLDINLRKPWYDYVSVRELLDKAHMVKLNIDELHELFDKLTPEENSHATVSQKVEFFLNTFDLQIILLTLGSKGATLYEKDSPTLEVHPESPVEVVDTVGAGDGFTSIMLLGIMKGWEHRTTLLRAQEFAGKIVMQRGATTNNRSFYDTFIHKWSL